MSDPKQLQGVTQTGNLHGAGVEIGRGTANANPPANPEQWRRTTILLKSEPLPSGHVYLNAPVSRCAACQLFLEQGDVYTLVTLGPGPDQAEQGKCREHHDYVAVAVPVHWTCATGLPA